MVKLILQILQINKRVARKRTTAAVHMWIRRTKPEKNLTFCNDLLLSLGSLRPSSHLS